jgi:hypothetical protein
VLLSDDESAPSSVAVVLVEAPLESVPVHAIPFDRATLAYLDIAETVNPSLAHLTATSNAPDAKGPVLESDSVCADYAYLIEAKPRLRHYNSSRSRAVSRGKVGG